MMMQLCPLQYCCPPQVVIHRCFGGIAKNHNNDVVYKVSLSMSLHMYSIRKAYVVT